MNVNKMSNSTAGSVLIWMADGSPDQVGDEGCLTRVSKKGTSELNVIGVFEATPAEKQ